jgi:hypothetical protein
MDWAGSRLPLCGFRPGKSLVQQGLEAHAARKAESWELIYLPRTSLAIVANCMFDVPS